MCGETLALTAPQTQLVCHGLECGDRFADRRGTPRCFRNPSPLVHSQSSSQAFARSIAVPLIRLRAVSPSSLQRTIITLEVGIHRRLYNRICGSHPGSPRNDNIVQGGIPSTSRRQLCLGSQAQAKLDRSPRVLSDLRARLPRLAFAPLLADQLRAKRRGRAGEVSGGNPRTQTTPALQVKPAGLGGQLTALFTWDATAARFQRYSGRAGVCQHRHSTQAQCKRLRAFRVSGTTVTLTLSPGLANGDAVTVSPSQPPRAC